jgi:hypothetical protein
MLIQPTTKSRYLSLAIVFLLASTIGLLAYLPATLEGEITDQTFTISQSLAFSIKPLFVVVFTIACSLIGYLIYYRGHGLMLLRIFLLLIMFALVTTLLWVTTFYNKTDHYILAAVIFFSIVIFIMLNNYVIFMGMKIHSKPKYIFLIGTPILAVLGSVGLILSQSEFASISELFPSFENFMLVVQGLSVIALGFI